MTDFTELLFDVESKSKSKECQEFVLRERIRIAKKIIEESSSVDAMDAMAVYVARGIIKHSLEELEKLG